MSVSLVDNSASGAGHRIRRVYSTMTGLDLVMYAGSDLATSMQNQAARGAVGGVVTSGGAPTFDASHIKIASGATKLDWSTLTETNEFTIITTMKPTGDLSVSNGRPHIAGWFDNNASIKGGSISISNAVNLRAQINYSVSGTPIDAFLNIGTYAVGELLVERLVALSVYSGGATLYDLTKNVQASFSNANPRALATGRGFRLGSNYNTTGTGPVDLSKTLLFRGVGLSKGEIDAVAIPIRSYLLDVEGIAV